MVPNARRNTIIGGVVAAAAIAAVAVGVSASGSPSQLESYGMASCTTDATGTCSFAYADTFGVAPASVELTPRVQASAASYSLATVAGSLTTTGGKARASVGSSPLANTAITFYYDAQGVVAESAPPPTSDAPPTTTAPPSTTPPPTTTAPPSTTPPPSSTPPPAQTGFPDATNTGVPAGTTLTNSGSITASTAGQVIDAKNITGTVVVKASGVVIENSKLAAGTSQWGIEVESGSVTVKNSELTGSAYGVVEGDNYTLEADNIHDFHGDGMKLGNNVTVQDTYIHDDAVQGGQHADGMQDQNGLSNVVIRHNHIVLSATNAGGANSAVFIKDDLGPASNGPITVDDNLLGGGGYTLYVYKGSSGLAQGGVTVTNNQFVRGTMEYGPVAVNIPVTAWSGNKWSDTGASISQ